MLLKIRSVDMDGFCGRENHPHPSDVGLVVVVLGCETMYTDAGGFEVNPMVVLAHDGANIWADEEAKKAAAFAIEDSEGSVISTMWICGTADGRLLDLMDHEVEMFRA